MKAPGNALTVSGGDYLLLGVWLKPAKIDELSNEATAAIADAVRDGRCAENALAWLRDLNRVVRERSLWRRAACVQQPRERVA
jgi:hypothetical protein